MQYAVDVHVFVMYCSASPVMHGTLSNGAIHHKTHRAPNLAESHEPVNIVCCKILEVSGRDAPDPYPKGLECLHPKD